MVTPWNIVEKRLKPRTKNKYLSKKFYAYKQQHLFRFTNSDMIDRYHYLYSLYLFHQQNNLCVFICLVIYIWIEDWKWACFTLEVFLNWAVVKLSVLTFICNAICSYCAIKHQIDLMQSCRAVPPTERPHNPHWRQKFKSNKESAENTAEGPLALHTRSRLCQQKQRMYSKVNEVCGTKFLQLLCKSVHINNKCSE